MSRPSESPTYDAPTSALAGETLVWLVAAPDTPSSDGWTLTVKLTPATGSVVSVMGTQEGSGPDFRVTVTAAQTATLGAGNVGWSAMATKALEGVALGRGRILLAADSGLTTDETRLVELDTVIHQLTLGGVQSYTAPGGRTFQKYDLKELRAQRNIVASRVRRARTGAWAVDHLVSF